MSLNTGGAGIAVPLSAKDDGFTTTFSKASKLVSSFGERIVGGLRTVGGHIQNIADDYKITTTQIEAYGVAAHKVTSATLAGLNSQAKGAEKWGGQIASVAFDMNTDVQGVADTFKALQQANIDVTKVGFKSFSEYQKFLSVTGADAKQFTFAISKMRNQFHMSDKDIMDSIQNVVTLGKQFNMGAEATQGMSDTINVLAEDGATLWAELGPQKTKQFLEGTQKLAIGFMKAGQSAEDAQKLALGVGQAMIKSRAGVQQLYTGLAEELPQAANILSENFGGVQQAFDALQNDPAELTKRIVAATGKIRQIYHDQGRSDAEVQARLARFADQMRTSFGPQFANLITNNAEKTATALGEVDKAAAKLGGKDGTIANMANQYSDGRTMTERLAISTEIFKTKLKGLMHESDSQFLNRFNYSAGQTLGKLDQISKKGGPLAKVTSLMEEFAMHGLGGVASMVSAKYGPAMAILIQQFGPVISQLHNIIPLLGLMTNPFLLIGAAIAAVVVGLNEFGGNTDELESTIVGFIDNVGKKIENFLGKIDWGKVFSVIGTAILEVGKIVFKYLGKIGSWLSDTFARIDWAGVAKSVKDGVIKIWPYIQKFLNGIADAVESTIKHLPDIGRAIGTAIANARTSMLTKQVNEEAKANSEMGVGYELLMDSRTKAQEEQFKESNALSWNYLKSDASLMERAHRQWMDETSSAYAVQANLLASTHQALSDKITKATANLTGAQKEQADSLLKTQLSDIERRYTWAVKYGNLDEQQSYELMTKLIANFNTSTQAAIDGYGKQDAAAQAAYDHADQRTKAQIDNINKTTKLAIESIKNITKIVTGVHNDVADAQDAAVKSLGVSQEDSEDILKRLIGGNKAAIIQNINEIGNSYRSFLKSVLDLSKTNLEQVKKNTDNVLQTVKDVFPKVANFINDFINLTSKSLTVFWSALLSQTRQSFAQIFVTASSLFDELRDKAVKMNLLDAMTPQNVIDSWAIRIVSTLQRVFSSNLNLGPAIQMAMNNIKDLRAQIGVNATDNRVAANSAAVQLSTAESSNALSAMLLAINNPAWVSDVESKEGIRHGELIGKMNTLISVSAIDKKIDNGKLKNLIDTTNTNLQ